MTMDRYAVTVYDRAGEYVTKDCADFAACLRTVASLRRSFPHKVVRAANLDRCDYDTDGLIEEEREAVDDA